MKLENKEPISNRPFIKMVKLTARAFYDDDVTTKLDKLPKNRSDNRGAAVVVLDALTRREWVRDEDLAKDLRMHTKQLRRTLRFFEEEKLIMRDHRKETVKGVKLPTAAVAATADGQPHKEGQEKKKMYTHSYCCLDYAQIYDVVRYRIHRMKKKLKEELESKDTIQKYICPNCSNRYNALDAARLISMEDESFHCESCNEELVVESDKLADQDLGDADANAKKRRQNKLQVMLQNMEVQLKPLMEHMATVKDLQFPYFGNLRTWEAKVRAAASAENENNNAYGCQGLSGAPFSFLGETKVEVSYSDGQANDGDKSGTANKPMKILPPWMIKQGMNLTSQQRGVEGQESKMEGSSNSVEPSDNKNSSVETDESKRIKDEYHKNYCAALYQRLWEQQQAAAAKMQQELSNDSSSTRQAGIKCKREEDDDEWKDGTLAGNVIAGENHKVEGLNLQATSAMPSNNEEEEDDDLEWEEG